MKGREVEVGDSGEEVTSECRGKRKGMRDQTSGEGRKEWDCGGEEGIWRHE